MLVRVMGTAVIGAALACGAGGCAVETVQPAPIFVTGRVTIDWTINGAVDPAQCRQGGATTFDVDFTDAVGRFAGEYQADCAAFATTIDLPPGGYTGSTRLLDDSGNARTTQVDLRPFSIIEGTNLDVSVEFPASSFF
ncbi:MAG: hypothetical protein ABIP89_24155 [Polyangiaceae bacterium]